MSYLAKFNDIKAFAFDVDGVLTDGTMLLMESGDFVRRMSIKDGYALQHAIKQEYHVWIISGKHSEGVVERLKDLGIFEIHTDIDNKKEVLQELMDRYDLEPGDVLYMGDDIPDLGAMQLCGLPVCPEDAANEIKKISSYISPVKGGNGCVRDVIEQVMKCQHKW